jgi:histone deacetylase 8
MQISSLLPSNKRRSILTHSLISSLGLLSSESNKRIRVVKPARATHKDLSVYHSRDYLDFVLNPATATTEAVLNFNVEFGLEDVSNDKPCLWDNF